MTKLEAEGEIVTSACRLNEQHPGELELAQNLGFTTKLAVLENQGKMCRKYLSQNMCFAKDISPHLRKPLYQPQTLADAAS